MTTPMPRLLFSTLVPVFFACSLFAADREWQRDGKKAAPNVLVIAVDDLRPEFGAYGAAHMRTPNLDALAASGVRFDRAYTAQAVCLPSRVSLLTGMRPDSTGVHDIWTDFRKTIPDAVTVVQHFRAHGYRTIGMGKVYHDEKPSEWNEWISFPDAQEYFSDEVIEILDRAGAEADAQGLKGRARREFLNGPAWEIVPDERAAKLHDTLMTDRAVAEIAESRDEPFFLVVGYKRPHLPFVAPKRFWDHYPASETKLPVGYRTGAPTAPPIALIDWGELRNYRGVPASGQMADDEALELIRGYRASVSYVDHEIGRLLTALGESGRDQDTIVVLWGDHGFKIGEYGLWCKHTNFEIDARVPLLVRAPGAGAAGLASKSPVELIDVFPTLCDLAGLPTPAQVEGTSLRPLLTGETPADWRGFARSQYKRERKTGGDIIGYSMRTVDHRYTEWRNRETDVLVATELYDHRTDPDELRNEAGDPATSELRADLSAKLAASRAKSPR